MSIPRKNPLPKEEVLSQGEHEGRFFQLGIPGVGNGYVSHKMKRDVGTDCVPTIYAVIHRNSQTYIVCEGCFPASLFILCL